MKSKNLLTLSFLTMSFMVPVRGQDMPGSNIVSRTFLSPSGSSKIVQRVYDNGLGDILQEIQSCTGSPLPSVIIHHEYDEYRRRTKDWLPVASSDSVFVSGNTISSQAGSQYSDVAPFSRTEYDGFLPLQPSAQYKAGSQWQGNGKKVSVTYSEFVGVGMYTGIDTVGYMYKLPNVKYLCTQTVDEDGCLSAEYTDFNGRVMVRETSQGKTYYIYNVKGDISYVIPPALSQYFISNYGNGVKIFDTDDMMRKYAYVYRYDKQRHCIYKKLPGCEPIYYIYDSTGACILTQDGNQRQGNEWTYTIPDRFGRPCISGVCSRMLSYTAEPLHSVCVYAEYDGTSVSTGGYAVHNLALGSQTLYSAAYYDDYSFIGHNGVPSSLVASSVSGFPVNTSLGRGLQTGIATAVLGSNGVTGYTYSAMYYDSRFNVAQVNSTNHLGGNDITCTTYSYTGKPLNVKTLHTKPRAGTLDVNCSYTYDGLDRLVQVTHSINGSTPVTLASYTYDAVGRVSSKTVGGMETTSYSYNIQSWPTKISGQRFTERLCYNAAVEGLAPGLAHQYRWNGTVAAYAWLSGGETLQRGYSLLYDGLDRLTTANYGEGPSLESYHTKYDEKAEYDCMGNPTWIYRRSPDVINDIRPSSPSDRLRLEYDGNHLVHVTDSVTSGHDYAGAFHFEDGADETVEYEYDGNGNMTKDLNRNITEIRYNSLNLPSMIAFGDNTYIYYTYSATGEKLTTRYAVRFLPMLAPGGGDPSSTEAESSGGMGDDISGSGTRVLPSVNPSGDMTKHYCGNVVYDSGERMLLTDEGYVTFAANGTPQYHYYLKDHLGNVRVVMGQAGAVEQVNHYYAFGSLMRESTSPGVQPYKYGGKELDRYSGLDAYDFGARAYFSDRMQWSTMDPLCEKYYEVSPYVYCHNNPLIRIDPNGKFDFVGINNNQYYPVIAVFPINEVTLNNQIKTDYDAALNSGMPIMLVENINDFADAMSHLQGIFSYTDSYTLNSHGFLGNEDNATSFMIGDDRVDADTDFSVLKNGLENHIVFIGACSVGNIQGRGWEMVSNMAEQTQSLVIASDHALQAGYAYDGSLKLNTPFFSFPMKSFENTFVASLKGDNLQSVTDVTINKNIGISWYSYPFSILNYYSK